MIVRLYNTEGQDEAHFGNWEEVLIEDGTLLDPNLNEIAHFDSEAVAWVLVSNGASYSTMKIQR